MRLPAAAAEAHSSAAPDTAGDHTAPDLDGTDTKSPHVNKTLFIYKSNKQVKKKEKTFCNTHVGGLCM